MTEKQTVRKPTPRIDNVNRPFWAACNEGRLVIQRCDDCSQHVFYPRVCCPYCRSAKLQWVEVSGRGKVETHSTIHRPHHEGFYAEAPYVFAAVRLEEGPIVFAQLVGAPHDTSLLRQDVVAAFQHHSAEQKILIFHLI